MRAFNLIGFLLCPLVVSGCGMEQQIASGVARAIVSRGGSNGSGAGVAPTGPTAGFRRVQGLKLTHLDQLTPVNSGKGLIVFEPVAATTAAPQKAFGAGCARWLHLNVAGQGELGKTPFWGEVDDARRSLQKPSLQFGLPEAQAAGKQLGVTHVALGKLAGSGASLDLSYRLYDVATGQPVGTPLQANGTPEAIAGALPQLARQMAAQLSLKAPSLPPRNELNAAALAVVGQVPWKDARQIKAAQVKQLKALAPHSPLAGLLLMRDASLTDAEWDRGIKQQLRLAPGNVLAMGDICRQYAAKTVKYRTLYDRIEKKFPNNYALARAHSFWCHVNRDYAGYTRRNEHAVKCSPSNGGSWYGLSCALSDLAGYVRQARYISQITGPEMTFLDGVYDAALDAGERAARMAPGDTVVWSHLAEAATFASDEQTADTALWKALQLDPTNGAAYSWGFEMYQPKWSNQPQKMLKLAKMAAAHADKCQISIDDMVGALHSCNLQGSKAPILAECARRAPQNPEALYEWGASLHYDARQYRKAETLYRKAISLDPTYARPVGSLADLTYWVKHDPKTAETLYRKAIMLEPGTASHYEDLARMLALTGRRKAAMSVIQTARRIGGNADHPVYGELGISP